VISKGLETSLMIFIMVTSQNIIVYNILNIHKKIKLVTPNVTYKALIKLSNDM
jgi:hypothetical protein